MDTKDAIATLSAMLTTLTSNIAGFQGQADAIQLAIDQLNGVLVTELTELDTANATIASLDENKSAPLLQVNTSNATSTPLQ